MSIPLILTGVPPELVPLDVLARAHMALAATASERKEKEDAVRLKVTKRIEDAKAKHDDEIKIRLAEANVRENAGKGDPALLRPDADAIDLLWAWAGGRPGWSRDWIAEKVQHAHKYVTEPVGALR